MIESPKKPEPTNRVANVAPDEVATNQRAVPLPYFAGRKWLNLFWGQRRVYNHRPVAVRQKVGKKSQTVGYDHFGDLFGLTSCCQVDYIEALEISGEIVWTGSVERNEDNPYYAEINLPDGSQWRFYWGTPDQPLDDLVLQSCGEAHPNYLDQSFIVGKDVYFGSSTTPPVVRVLAERAARFDGLDEARSREGSNGITALAEVIGNDWYGLGRPDLIHVESWAALAEAIKRPTAISLPLDPEHTAMMGYISPFIDRVQSAEQFIAEVLENYDAWVRPNGGQLEAGQFTHDGEMPVDLPELTYHDFTRHPSFQAGDEVEIITDAKVIHLDRDLYMKETFAPGMNPAARQRLGEVREKTFRRPFIVTSYQAREQGSELTKFYARPETRANASIRREKLGSLRAGDRFIINDTPNEALLVVRITQRVDEPDSDEVRLSLVAERGLAPLPFVAPPDEKPDLPDPEIESILNGRIFQLPIHFGDFGPAPAVVPLAARPASHMAGYEVHYSADDTTYDQLVTVPFWALRGTLSGGIDGDDGSMTITVSGPELGLLVGQGPLAQHNDTLLAFIDFELCSIGEISALGAGQYSVAITRGRRGSAAAPHSNGAVVWIMPRDRLTILQHADFPRTPDTRYFKLQAFSVNEEEELATSLRIVFVFDTAGVAAPSTLTADARIDGIFVKWSNPLDPTIILTEIIERNPGDGAPSGSDTPTYYIRGSSLSVTGLGSNVTKSYYARNRDRIGDASDWVGPAAATSIGPATEADVQSVQDLVDQVMADLDALELETTQLGADLIAEVQAREAAIIQETSERETEDGNLLTLLNALSADYNGNKATVASQLSTLTSENSAQASDITALYAGVADNAATISTVSIARADGDTALAADITTLDATVAGINASVNLLNAAYVVGGQAVATAGFELDANGKIIGLQGIAASGGGQPDFGAFIFIGADVQNDGFSSGVSGWRLQPNGDAEFNDVTVRGLVAASLIDHACMFIRDPASSEGGQLFLQFPSGGGYSSSRWAMDVWSDNRLRFFPEDYAGGTLLAEFQANVDVTGDLDAGGDIYCGGYGFGDFTTFSGRAMKSNIRSMAPVLDRLLKIRGIEFEWNGNDPLKRYGQRDISVEAEAVEAEFPELVVRDRNGNLAYRPAGFIGLLIEAIREVNNRLPPTQSRAG